MSDNPKVFLFFFCIAFALVVVIVAHTVHPTCIRRRVLDTEVVKNCLQIMFSCGMADFSGEWAYTVGVPAIRGISGGLMVFFF